MAQRRYLTTKKRARSGPTCPPSSGSDLSGLALLATTIGNIVQASQNSTLRQERATLQAVLREWQDACRRLADRAKTLRAAFEQVSSQLEQAEKDKEQWHLKFIECEKKLRQLEAAQRKGGATC